MSRRSPGAWFREKVGSVRQWSESPDERAKLSLAEIAQQKPRREIDVKNVASLGVMVLCGALLMGIGIWGQGRTASINSEALGIEQNTLQLEVDKNIEVKKEKNVKKPEDIKAKLAEAQATAREIATIQTDWIGVKIDSSAKSTAFIKKQTKAMEKHLTQSAIDTNSFGLTTAWFVPEHPQRSKHGVVTSWKPAKKGDFFWRASDVHSVDVDGTVRAAWELREKGKDDILAWATASYAGQGTFGGFTYNATSYGADYMSSTESDGSDNAGGGSA